MLQQVYQAFGLGADPADAIAFGSGLINHTWKIRDNNREYILQRINQEVFTQPFVIAENMRLTRDYLARFHPAYLFVGAIPTVNGEELFFDGKSGYFRLTPFIPCSHTIDVVTLPGQAYEAARQFGLFTRLLCGFEVQKLQISIPEFHNLSLRYQQFEHALVNGNPARINQSAELIDHIRTQRSIVDRFESLRSNPAFKLRATHCDTKISNVLFDKEDKGLCVIDLDTLMPGYFISDLGDMMRTYLSPVSEEESDFSRIRIREEYFHAIVEGYLGELRVELSEEELDHVVYAGKFMIYMQAIRFLTDHLQNDIYYGARYEGHNYVRAGNQLTLLEKLVALEDKLSAVIRQKISA